MTVESVSFGASPLPRCLAQVCRAVQLGVPCSWACRAVRGRSAHTDTTDQHPTM